MEKRYAIVRVEGKCGKNLEYYECDYDCCDCKYGDTKEQLIRKVAQALERTIIDGVYVRFGIPITVEKLAKEIVEFLGVE